MGQVIHKRAAEAFLNRDKEAFALHSKRFLQMLEDVDELLRTRPEFNFRPLADICTKLGEYGRRNDLLEYDATSLVTIWGSDGDPSIFSTTHGENGRDLLKGIICRVGRSFMPCFRNISIMEQPIRRRDYVRRMDERLSVANDFYSKLGDWELQLYLPPIRHVLQLYKGMK